VAPKRSGWIFAAVAAVLAGGGYYAWMGYSNRFPNTSDAYIGAHVARIAPQVGGRVAELPVTDHERVAEGQLLVALDAAPYRIALHRAQGTLALAKQTRAEAVAAVDAAQALVEEGTAAFEDAQGNDTRLQDLVKQKSVSPAEADSARFKLREARAALSAARFSVQEKQRSLDQADARIRVSTAELEQAQLDLAHTRITAPAAGVVGELNVRPGDVVSAGQQLFPLVEDSSLWIDANYKETDLRRIRPGQPASISVDMYPGASFHGTVESLSPAAGTAFSLLPPENATGNWVKVTQRFPVRIRILDRDPSRPLPVGASGHVRIDTGRQASPQRQAVNETQEKPFDP
jgi:membrane fusion protein (multidrug efflux system)